jgi:hypothetical protein
MSTAEAADIIEGFLTGAIGSIEWCDFAETGRQRDPIVECCRKRCDTLSPLVNRPGVMDQAAVAELKSTIQELRSQNESPSKNGIEQHR